MAKKSKPGDPPLNRVGVYDHRLNLRGHVGKTASSATASRFLGVVGATLGTVKGRPAWIGPKPPWPKH